ncbi:hypothetical protein BDV37DRAFT_28262 [Aspergillus pseudonomiae]|uniref:Uncharacterized protein n=1 Tax=Aspergillus pseudonomiae TaxID=1506151 RepID=A0A5N7DM81_9EURO|nr:uncharacterized protein BDV37DRAFT_28262 [Aspergillus pseudonomiae]KAE8407159.1 hypothetical protein BDV37DRAFT_28262 [Aspergillus pseudonomiae]
MSMHGNALITIWYMMHFGYMCMYIYISLPREVSILLQWGLNRYSKKYLIYLCTISIDGTIQYYNNRSLDVEANRGK